MKKKYQNYLPYLIIAVVTLSVFWETLGYDFLAHTWDDKTYVTGNPLVQKISWVNIKGVFSHYFLANYAPIHMLSYMVDHAIWGMNPTGFRLTNLLLHIFNALFLYLLIKELTRRKDISLIAALIFSVHPLQVETVAWVSQRKSLLAVALFLPAFYLYLTYLRSGRHEQYWTSVALYTLSLLTKVSTITLPILLLLYDYAFLERIGKRNWVNKIPYVFAAGCISCAAIFGQTQRPTLFYGDSFLFTMLVEIEVFARYMGSLLFPINLSAYYPFFFVPLPHPTLLLSFVLLVLMVWGVVFLFREDRHLGFWGGWFFVAMLPNMNIVPLEVLMADRYLYIPLIGPAVLFAYLLSRMFRERQGKHFHNARFLFYGTALVVLCFYATLSYTRTRVWKDDLSLWTDTTNKVQHGIPYTNLGISLFMKGHVAKAEDAFKKAIVFTPNFDRPYKKLGHIALIQRKFAKAEHYLKKAVGMNPWHLKSQQLLAVTYVKKGDIAAARNVLENALEYLPESAELKSMILQLNNGSWQKMGDVL